MKLIVISEEMSFNSPDKIKILCPNLFSIPEITDAFINESDLPATSKYKTLTLLGNYQEKP